jgi:hypothetical protein
MKGVFMFCLDQLSFYKIWFLVIVYKNCVNVFGDQFLKTK